LQQLVLLVGPLALAWRALLALVGVVWTSVPIVPAARMRKLGD